MKKRILSLLICGLLAVSVCSCDRIPGAKLYEEITQDNEITQDDGDVALVIGEMEVSKSDYEFFYKSSLKSYMQMTGENAVDITTDEFKTQLEDEVIDFFKGNAATFAYAKSIGIDTENVDPAKVDEMTQYYAQMFMMYYGADINELYGDYLPELMRMIVVNEEIFSKKMFEAVTQEEVKEYVNDNFFTSKHILVKTVDDEGNEYEGDTLAEKVALAEDLYKRATAGEDFDALIKEYGEDPGMQSNPDGYTFGPGEMVTEFYEGTKALDINGISEPVKSTYGYHIIKRLPLALTEEEITAGIEDYAYTILSESGELDIINQEVTDGINAVLQSLTVERKEVFNAITIDAYKAELEKEIADEAAAIAEETDDHEGHDHEGHDHEGEDHDHEGEDHNHEEEISVSAE